MRTLRFTAQHHRYRGSQESMLYSRPDLSLRSKSVSFLSMWVVMSSWNNFEVKNVNEQTILATVTCSVLLDNVVVEQFRQELMEIVSSELPQNVLVDFTRLSRSSTAVINSMLAAKKKLLASGGDLMMCGLQESIRHNFRILNLEGTVFQIFEDQEEALAQLGIG